MNELMREEMVRSLQTIGEAEDKASFKMDVIVLAQIGKALWALVELVAAKKD